MLSCKSTNTCLKTEQKTTNKKKKSEIITAKSVKTPTSSLYRIDGQKQEKQGFAVQVAALNQRGSLLRKKAELQKMYIKNVLIHYDNIYTETINYKVLIGPFPTALEASNYQKNLKKKKILGFIVDLTTL